MISSASTLLLATLVFSSVSVLGAPIRIADTSSEVVARAVISTPSVQPIARADIVDVEIHSRHFQDGALSRRTARLVPRSIEVREPVDSPAPIEQREERPRRYARRAIYESLEGREPAPVAQQRQVQPRNYPRRILHEFYEKREPATIIKEDALIYSKTTKHDTPADAAAVAGAPGVNVVNTGVAPSAVSITIPIPSVPAVPALGGLVSGGATLSVSSQTTILAPAAASATLNAASSAAAAAATTTAAPASATISAAATSASANGDGAASATVAPIVDGAPGSATAAPVVNAAPASAAPVVDGTAPVAEPSSTGTTSDASSAPAGDAPPASIGSDASSSAANSVPVTPTADNNTPPASVGASVDGTTNVPARRSVESLPQTLVRRLAVSGSSWASAVRRQIDSQ